MPEMTEISGLPQGFFAFPAEKFASCTTEPRFGNAESIFGIAEPQKLKFPPIFPKIYIKINCKYGPGKPARSAPSGWGEEEMQEDTGGGMRAKQASGDIWRPQQDI